MFYGTLFLKIKKISEKAVKLGSLPQYSAHLLLGLDGCL